MHFQPKQTHPSSPNQYAVPYEVKPDKVTEVCPTEIEYLHEILTNEEMKVLIEEIKKYENKYDIKNFA